MFKFLTRSAGGRCRPSTNPPYSPYVAPGFETQLTTTPAHDPVVERVRNKLLTRSSVGLKKYKVGLDRTDLTHLQWLVHHQDELLDAANYVERQIVAEENKLAKERIDGTPRGLDWFAIGCYTLAIGIFCLTLYVTKK